MSISLEGKTVLVTGSSGFIGYFLCKHLLENFANIKVIGFDNNNDYYDPTLKTERIRLLNEMKKDFTFVLGNLEDKAKVDSLFTEYKPKVVVHLAAQAGVRYSITNPEVYINSNIIGFFNIIEACRHNPVEHLLFASSSSVYGANTKSPSSTDDKTDCPVALYGATKKANELFGYAYSKLYKIPSTGLRFFSVYGPLGRPDMAAFKFANQLAKGETIDVYNNGDMWRDFTYVDDIVTGVVKLMQRKPVPDEHNVEFKVYNIGHCHPERLMDFIDILEGYLIQEGVIKEKGKKNFLPMQPGDVYKNFADCSELEKDVGFKPCVDLKDGLYKFVKWYKEYYKY